MNKQDKKLLRQWRLQSRLDNLTQLPLRILLRNPSLYSEDCEEGANVMTVLSPARPKLWQRIKSAIGCAKPTSEQQAKPQRRYRHALRRMQTQFKRRLALRLLALLFKLARLSLGTRKC
jgi:hypothetical protein